MGDLKTELLFEISLELGEAQEIGVTPHGTRRIVPVAGGTFAGPKLNGWLNRIIAVGTGRRTPTGVGYTVYAIV